MSSAKSGAENGYPNRRQMKGASWLLRFLCAGVALSDEVAHRPPLFVLLWGDVRVFWAP